MKYPVYRFSDVLRALRERSGLTVLEAAAAASYGNYERWESGKTRVGADHLANIGEAFDVGNELWLLVYAWLVDRFSPLPDEEPVEVSGAIAKQVNALPKTRFDVGRYSRVALGEMSHGQLALVALTARYGRGYAGADRELFLPPRARSTLPECTSRSESVLGSLYGDVFVDVAKWVARTCIRGGLRGLRPDVQSVVDRQSLLYLSEPGFVEELATAGDPPRGRRLRGFDRLARLAARLAPSARRVADSRLEQLRDAEEQARGEPVTIDGVKTKIQRVARDDRLWDPAAAADQNEVPDLPVLPDPDPVLDRETTVLHDQVDRALRRALAEELEDAWATAQPASAFDAIRALDTDSSGASRGGATVAGGGTDLVDHRRRARQRRRSR
jgi:transcriptional regulator with XRE-family HTH domain